jgi:DNA adenine methylase
MSFSYLKWIGGKTQIADELFSRFPSKMDRYIEAFCGSAALFFIRYGRAQSDSIFGEELPPAILNDINLPLLNCHREVQYRLDKVFEFLNILEKQHKEDPEGTYRKIRSELHQIFECSPAAERSAADFIYINKTCFNGLWRVNSKGGFNVPFNGKLEIEFDRAQIRRCSELLRKHATVRFGYFDTFLMREAKKGDFVFLDPPYVPISITSSFTGYTADGWSDKDDLKLVEVMNHLDSIGVKFMMTNSNAEKVYQLFGKWNITTVKAHRFVKALNGEGETRSKVDETITTNY